jgi:hypothetical protein
MKPVLKIDWATHEAAKYACENWHYSESIPKSKLVKIGAWEDERFIGVVIFSYGATPQIGSPYNLKQIQVCELTRIALNKHSVYVSKILSIAIRFLKKANPGLRLIVSFADTEQNHHGGIYQATNWIYAGTFGGGTRVGWFIKGRKTHTRTVGSMPGGVQSTEWVRKNLDPKAREWIGKDKHRYLMPLDSEMRKQILPLSRPYPKRAQSIENDATGIQPDQGGANQTCALQTSTE